MKFWIKLKPFSPLLAAVFVAGCVGISLQHNKIPRIEIPAASVNEDADKNKETDRSESAKEPEKSTPESAKEPEESTPESAKEPEESTPEPTKEPEESTPEPTKEPEESTPEPTKEPEESTPEPTKEPEESTPEPTKEPEKSTPEPTKEPEKSTPEPTKEPEKSTPEPTEEPEESTPEPEKEAQKYRDGVYEASAVCMPDEYEDFDEYHLTLKVRIENGRIVEITDVSGDGSADNKSFINRAVKGSSKSPGVVAQIVDKGMPEGIDAVSGATCSSEAIAEACRRALEIAGE